MLGFYGRLGLPLSASHRQVIRACRGRMRPDVLYDRALRKHRHTLYRRVLAIHEKGIAIKEEFRL